MIVIHNNPFLLLVSGVKHMDILNYFPYQHSQLQLVFQYHSNLTADLAGRHGPELQGK